MAQYMSLKCKCKFGCFQLRHFCLTRSVLVKSFVRNKSAGQHCPPHPPRIYPRISSFQTGVQQPAALNTRHIMLCILSELQIARPPCAGSKARLSHQSQAFLFDGLLRQVVRQGSFRSWGSSQKTHQLIELNESFLPNDANCVIQVYDNVDWLVW